jgi:hypothetical protein
MHSFLKKKLTALDSINHEVLLEIFLAFLNFSFKFEFLNSSGFDRPVPLPYHNGKTVTAAVMVGKKTLAPTRPCEGILVPGSGSNLYKCPRLHRWKNTSTNEKSEQGQMPNSLIVNICYI